MSAPPLFLQRRCTDEYRPQPYAPVDQRVLRRAAAALASSGAATERMRTAAGLRALNDEWGAEFFAVPPEAAADPATAEAVFSGPEVVIDVQTHFLAPHAQRGSNPQLEALYRAVMPPWWREMDDIVARDVAEYITNVFLETETAVAVLTSGPGVGEDRHLFNDEMAATRALVDGLAGSGRLLNHAVVHADVPGELEAMRPWRDEHRPVGWKVYTLGGTGRDDRPRAGWMLDDERHGLPFLERARDLGVPLVCVHKGISGQADNGSPRDIGPAARRFPDLDFVVYHSGYEFPAGDEVAEGPYTDETAHLGVNRLLRSVEDAGLGEGGNVYAELGTTWFALLRRPWEAAQLLGKLIAVLGEDNVVWGTDSIWYGSAQPLIDALRVFQIPDELCEHHGYAPLTDRVKARILGENAARLYGVDLEEARRARADDDLAWARELVRELREDGFPGLR